LVSWWSPVPRGWVTTCSLVVPSWRVITRRVVSALTFRQGVVGFFVTRVFG
jgi:hypothetical protein